MRHSSLGPRARIHAGVAAGLVVAAFAQRPLEARPARPKQASTQLTTRPAAATDAWLAAASERLRAAEYRVSPRTESPGWSAPNRAQGFRTAWLDGGLELTPHDGGTAWSFRYELAVVGRGGAQAAPDVLPIAWEAVDGGGIEWRRGTDVREWYRNDERGLEQGFVIERRPEGASANPLVIAGRIAGLLANPTADGSAISLRDAAGANVLRIAQLAVRDATGRVLTACFDVAPGRLDILVDDRDAVYPLDVDPLVTSSAWSVESTSKYGRYGDSVATAGDVNGDGYSDVIVGASDYTNPEQGEGMAFLYVGSPAGLSLSPAWTAEGDQPSARLGTSVSTAGDVDGDGFADVLVGAPGFTNDLRGEGRVYVYRGSPTGLSPTPAWTLEGDEDGARFGSIVAPAGDVNGDGFGDIIVTAPYHDGGERDEGQARLYLGSASGLQLVPAWTWEPDQPDCWGGVVALAGDVNGDGYADVAVGIGAYDTGPRDEGRVVVFMGSPAGLQPTPAWTVDGSESEDWFGGSVSTAGDTNGDGYADLIVGSTGYLNRLGGAFVYLGSPAGLATTPAWTWWPRLGPFYHLAGAAVATAGDVNGDGFADVLVGHVGGSDVATEDRGDALVFLGSPTGPATSPAWHAKGPSGDSGYGGVLATAGDVNGDGYSDWIAGAPNYSPVDDWEGAAFAYLGSAEALSASAGWTAEGSEDFANFGSSVSTAGDVNGDGYSDVVVGIAFADAGALNAGAVVAFLGSVSGLDPVPAWRADGTTNGGRLGHAVSWAGDVNGDGFSDVIVGEPNSGSADQGSAHVYLGSPAGLQATASWTAPGDQAWANFGLAVSGAGDVNGDGYADVLVAAPNHHNDGAFYSGRVYAYLGSATGLEPAPSWSVAGDQEDMSLGASVSGAGDVNGDGYSDVVVGAPAHAADRGRIWLYLGSPSGLSPLAAWTADGTQVDAAFGYCVRTAGDVNGDGYSDVIVGAPRHDSANLDAGRAVVYLGSPSGLAPSPAWSVLGDEAWLFLGDSVAGAGDVNGDGYSDVIIGAYPLQNNLDDKGRAYAYLGSASGLATVPAWTANGDGSRARFGLAVSTAGDVNGDGYADVIVGAPLFRGTAGTGVGGTFAYFGNAGDGLDRLPRQRRPDDSAPIDALGLVDPTAGFGIHARARSPFGRDLVRIEAEVKPLGTPFDGTGLITTPYVDTGAPAAAGSLADLDVLKAPLAGGPQHWRVRIRNRSTFPWQSHWMTLPYNAVTETDLRTPTEAGQCADGIDNDDDGSTDCSDPDCAADPNCLEQGHCADGIDNDGDGSTDCADPDCAADPGCLEQGHCADGIDNDDDGSTDCADPDCAADPDCLEQGHCADGIDNDGDGSTDCADPDCAADCFEQGNCADGIDNDRDGSTDCADPDCRTDAACPERDCTNRADDDGDGATDCADADCAGHPACVGEGVLRNALISCLAEAPATMRNVVFTGRGSECGPVPSLDPVRDLYRTGATSPVVIPGDALGVATCPQPGGGDNRALVFYEIKESCSTLTVARTGPSRQDVTLTW